MINTGASITAFLPFVELHFFITIKLRLCCLSRSLGFRYLGQAIIFKLQDKTSLKWYKMISFCYVRLWLSKISLSKVILIKVFLGHCVINFFKIYLLGQIVYRVAMSEQVLIYCSCLKGIPIRAKDYLSLNCWS